MKSWLFAAALVSAGVANAAQFVTFGSQTGGATAFDAAVVAAGDAVATVAVPSFDFELPALTLPGGITVTKNDGSFITGSGVYSFGAQATTGGTIDISPNGEFPFSNGDSASGVTFQFDQPVNALGFEVGDWGTCCHPSALFISFDDGAPIQVGLSVTGGDVFLTGGEPIVFVGAFDDSGRFSKVQFWGDGSGEFLVIGGTLRTANLDFDVIGDGSSFQDPLLPTSIDPVTNRFIFDTIVVPNQRIVIDPDVAIGYDYLFTGARATSLELEDLGDPDGYDIFLLSDLSNPVLTGYMPSIGNIVDLRTFDPTGLAGFRVAGIDVSLGLDPTDPTAFKTGLTFAVNGPTNIQISQTPLSVFVPAVVPEPASWTVMTLALAAMGGVFRRRNRTSRGG